MPTPIRSSLSESMLKLFAATLPSERHDSKETGTFNDAPLLCPMVEHFHSELDLSRTGTRADEINTIKTSPLARLDMHELQFPAPIASVRSDRQQTGQMFSPSGVSRADLVRVDLRIHHLLQIAQLPLQQPILPSDTTPDV